MNGSTIAEKVSLLTSEIQEYYTADKIPWVIGFSGGKDSTATLQLVWRALASLPTHERRKAVHVISTDTRVEQPLVVSHVAASLNAIEEGALRAFLPITVHAIRPSLSQSFWVNLLGRGYPAPSTQFRWCTDRMKIKPSNEFVRATIAKHGRVLMVLGTRKAESARRAAGMERHAEGRTRSHISENANLPGSEVYSPIEDWSNDEVWTYLMQVKSPWGADNGALVSLYRGASPDNECPLVIDTSTPSCGNSRFGCWTCTVVEKDRSMEALVNNDEGNSWMQPLLDFRDELKSNTKKWRDIRRMNGRVEIGRFGTPIPGPYTREGRAYLLRRLLETEKEAREQAPLAFKTIELISDEELIEIRRLWVEDKGEFEDILPRIASSFGRTLPIPEKTGLGAYEFSLLSEVCPSDLDRELLQKMLALEESYRFKARRIGISTELEKLIAIRGYTSLEEAVREALCQAAPSENLEEIPGEDV